MAGKPGKPMMTAQSEQASGITMPLPPPTQHRLRHLSLIYGALLVMIVLLPAFILWVQYLGHGFAINLHDRLKPPALTHWLGTDPLGRNTLALVLVAAFNSIAISIAAMALALLAGTALGLVAAEVGGKTGTLTDGLSDLGIAFPPVITAALLVTLYGAGVGEEILALALFFVPGFIRLGQQSASTILLQDYCAAARLAALNPLQIYWRHVLPNMVPGLVVQFSVSVALALLAETGLSYLGLGAPPPLPELGRLLASYQAHIFDHLLLVAVPGVVVIMLVLGINMLGDGLRDLFDIQEKSA